MKNIRRCRRNPLIVPADVVPSQPDLEVVGAFNAGAIRVGDEVVLLVRVAERPMEREADFVHAPYWDMERGSIRFRRFRRSDPELEVGDERVFRYRGEFYLTSVSHLRVARSFDGQCFSIDEQPSLAPADELECYGLEDARITEMDGEFLITYKAVSRHGVTTALARTSDFASYERLGTIFCPENLDVVIFPEKICGKYISWTRPVGVHQSAPSIWLAKSDDLIHWGEHRPVMAPRPERWDSARIGAGCVPFRFGDHWVEIYHGADASHRYSTGIALIDADDPARIVARSAQPIIEPEVDYELEGFFGGVVFPCGHVLGDDGHLIIYYGAADETVCAAEMDAAAICHQARLQ